MKFPEQYLAALEAERVIEERRGKKARVEAIDEQIKIVRERLGLGEPETRPASKKPAAKKKTASKKKKK